MGELGRRAKAASRTLATASTGAKDAALNAAADLLQQRAPEILEATPCLDKNSRSKLTRLTLPVPQYWDAA